MSKRLPPKPLPKNPIVRRGLGGRPVDLSQCFCACSGRGCVCAGVDGGSMSNPQSGRSSLSLNSNYRGVEKALGIPRANSSKTHEKLVQEAIQSISSLPQKIEETVTRKAQLPKFQKTLMHKATMVLNVPKNGKIYHDLLDIETVPPIQVKRAAPVEPKQLDPVPLITDYNKPEYIRIPPPPPQFPPLPRRERRRPNIIDLNSNFDRNDLLQYERRFSSMQPY